MSAWRKTMAILVVVVFLFVLAVTAVSAAETLEVRKIVQNADDITVGDDVTILLKFKNPFKQEIPIQIVDRNVIGNNGLDIQCLEATLPAMDELVLAYEPIVPFKAGKYTLDAAAISFTNPNTGDREAVESNIVSIEVKGDSTTPQAQQKQGITTIYRCGGTNIQSTSYSASSTSSSLNIRMGGQQSGSQQQGSVEQRVANNQLNQNSGQLKKELEQELQRQQELEEQISKELANNSEFQQYDAQLRAAGFNQTQPSFNPIAQNHTQITVPYRNESAERKIKADYIHGTIQNVTLEESTPEEKAESKLLWWLLILIAVVFVTGWYLYEKYYKSAQRQELPPIAVESAQTVDYVGDARRMVEEAEFLFQNNREKDAYEKISRAIRFYFSYKLGLNTELLNTELLNTLSAKRDLDTYSEVKSCLDLCGKVEFASYKSKEKDFHKVVEITKAIIV